MGLILQNLLKLPLWPNKWSIVVMCYVCSKRMPFCLFWIYAFSLNCIFSSFISMLFLFLLDLQFLEMHVKTLPTTLADLCIFFYLFDIVQDCIVRYMDVYNNYINFLLFFKHFKTVKCMQEVDKFICIIKKIFIK